MVSRKGISNPVNHILTSMAILKLENTSMVKLRCRRSWIVPTLPKKKCWISNTIRMNNEDHFSAVGNQDASEEITARPDDPSSIHNSLTEIEEDDNFAEVVNS
jgi:hypothetical protein